MSTIKHNTPNRLRIRSNQGCSRIMLGWPFLLAGLFILARTFDIIHANSDLEWSIGIPFGILFSVIGIGMLCLTREATIDLAAGTATAWITMLVPLRRRTYKLSGTESVTLEKVVRRGPAGSSNRPTVFSVYLDGEFDVLTMDEADVYEDARRTAEMLADFMSVKLIDKSSGRAVERRPATLNQSLREQAKNRAEPQELPHPPPNLRSVISINGDTVTIAVPIISALFSMKVMSEILSAILWAAFISWKFIMPLVQDTTMGLTPQLVLLLFFGLLGIVLPLAAIIFLISEGLAGWTTFFISPEAIRIKEHGRIITKQMKSEAIEEALFEGYNIIIRSDMKTFNIALRSKITADERRYIKALIETIIAA